MIELPGLPEGYTAQPASLETIPEAAECLNACSIAELGHADVSPASLSAMWTLPEVDVSKHVVYVRSPSGQLVGVESAISRRPHAVIWSWGGVHPDHTGRGIGTALLDWAGKMAIERVSQADLGIEVLHEVFHVAAHEPSVQLMSDHGFVLDRYHNAMTVEFDGPPEEPVLPEGVEVRPVRLGIDEGAAALAAEEAFLDHYGHIPSEPDAIVERFTHWINHDDADPSLNWIAWDGDEVAGTLSCWPTGDVNPEYGHVGSLGVRRPWRGRGLGRALLLWAFGEFYRRGKGGAELEVDSENLTGALRLYESVGMETHGVYAQVNRVIRPGRSVTTSELS